jgi:mono/diheme cytochrome c family protein
MRLWTGQPAMPGKYVAGAAPCHNRRVRARARWPFRLLALLAIGGPPGCKSSGSAAECPPAPVNPPCPDAPPSFAGDVYPNVFVPICVPCHGPGGQESNMPFTSYPRIYGTNGSTAREIYAQVFENCLMPPAGSPPLSDQQRQKLLDWFGCGAPDTGAPDAAAP